MNLLAVHWIMPYIRQYYSVSGDIKFCTLQIFDYFLTSNFCHNSISTHLVLCWSVRDWTLWSVLPAAGCMILFICSCLVTFLDLYPNFHLQSLFKILRVGTCWFGVFFCGFFFSKYVLYSAQTKLSCLCGCWGLTLIAS